MRVIMSVSSSLVFCAFFGIGAMGCGGSDSGSTATNPWTYEEHQYRVTSVASDPGLDFSGDGTPDNKFKELMANQYIKDTLFAGKELSVLANEFIGNGDGNIFLSIYAKDMQSSENARLWEFLGKPGKNSTQVDLENGPSNAYFKGGITQGSAKFDSMTPSFTFVLPYAAMILKMPVSSAKIQFTVSTDTTLKGIVAGYITEDDFVNTLLSDMATELGITKEELNLQIDNLLKIYDLNISGKKAISFAIGFKASKYKYDHEGPKDSPQ